MCFLLLSAYTTQNVTSDSPCPCLNLYFLQFIFAFSLGNWEHTCATILKSWNSHFYYDPLKKIKMSLSFKIFTWKITYYSYAMLCSHSNAITSKILFFPRKKLCSFDPCANVHPYHVDIMYITVGRIRGKTLFAKLTIMYYRISHTATVFMLST